MSTTTAPASTAIGANRREIFPPADQALALWEGLLSAGRNFGILPVGLGARDTLRLEAGMPLYGHELGMGPDGKEIPIFALPLATVAVSLSPLKGDFIGRQALAAQWRALERQRDGDFSESGVLPRRIKCLALEEKGVARQGAEVFYDQEKVGDVTSGTAVPYWVFAGEGLEMRPTGEQSRRSIGLAYLQAWIQPETKVLVKVRNRMIQARVVAYHGRSEAPPYFHPLPAGYIRPVPETPEGRALGRLRRVLEKSWENHAWRQGRSINLIPSEMTPSPLVRLTQVADPVGRYAEHKDLAAAYDQEIFYYQGCDFIAWVEEQLAAEIGRFMGCPLVECRPVSGQMANMTVFSGLVQWRNRANLKREPGRISLAFTNHIGKGGHLSAQPMGALRDYIAKDPLTERFSVVNFPVLADNPYLIDLEALERLLDEYDPELIVFGKSMVLHKEPVAQVRAMLEARQKKPIIMYDMAHVLGLIGPHFQEPFAEGADIVTGSTHKTFFGTQRGVIGCRFDQENTPEHELWQAVRKRSFPGMVSNHHLGTLLGLLVASIEMNAFKDSYQPRVVANAKAFARALKACGLDVQGDPGIDYTETHQVVVKVGYARGPDVAKALENNQIICNYQALPDDEGFTASSGLRLGVSEMTRFGMQEKDFEALAQLMADCILKNQDVTEAVIRLRQDFQELGYCFGEDQVQPFKERFLQTLG
ncbi:MAG: glycine cleavage system protein T [Thermodesulfobacteriota bacterium]